LSTCFAKALGLKQAKVGERKALETFERSSEDLAEKWRSKVTSLIKEARSDIPDRRLRTRLPGFLCSKCRFSLVQDVLPVSFTSNNVLLLYGEADNVFQRHAASGNV
jgi:hypothetical protein